MLELVTYNISVCVYVIYFEEIKYCHAFTLKMVHSAKLHTLQCGQIRLNNDSLYLTCQPSCPKTEILNYTLSQSY